MSSPLMNLVAPSRVRGLKQFEKWAIENGYSRTFTGAWIETLKLCSTLQHEIVAPSRVRGLKQIRPYYANQLQGRTFTGAWIET